MARRQLNNTESCYSLFWDPFVWYSGSEYTDLSQTSGQAVNRQLYMLANVTGLTDSKDGLFFREKKKKKSWLVASHLVLCFILDADIFRL